MATKTNTTPTHDPRTGLQNAMPKAPGDKLAGVPAPEHVVAAESGPPPYLDPSKAKWTRERVDATFGQVSKGKTGAPDVSDLLSGSPTVRLNPPYRINTSVKEPKRSG
jgi:hypothetical protein